MAFEIEMKAWVRNRPAVLAFLSENAQRVRDYTKDDEYRRAPLGVANGRPQEFRLRIDDQLAVCTFKDKQIVDGLEVNREREFTVDDPDCLRELLDRIGCAVFLRKVKRGTQFSLGGVNAELSDVESLGTFLELEIVRDEEGDIEAARASLQDLFLQAGISLQDVESRTYTSMLLNRAIPDSV